MAATALSGSIDKTLKLWDVATGKELRTFTGHTGFGMLVAFSPDGRTTLAGGGDDSVRLWDIQTGRERARMISSARGEWMTMTPEGFFHASHRDTEMLAIVQGLSVTTIGQVHQSLFNPDLVREALVGDPDSEVARAAKAVNLDKVLSAGPPPVATITSHAAESKSSADLVSVVARITDHGKGVGAHRVARQWRDSWCDCATYRRWTGL